jgi:hypothetical protein
MEFLMAAREGDHGMVEKMLSTGEANIKDKDDDGCTALLLAALNGQTGLVKWLLSDGGASINEADTSGNTAMLHAVIGHHTRLVKWLLVEGGASIEEANKHKMTAMLHASLKGNKPLVEWLLVKGGASIKEADEEGDTAPLFAAYHGNQSLVQWLLLYDGSTPTEKLWNEMAEKLWNEVVDHIGEFNDINKETVELLQVMTLLGDVPSGFIDKLNKGAKLVVEKVAQFNKLMLLCNREQADSINTHCPLYGVLSDVVVSFASPTTKDRLEQYKEYEKRCKKRGLDDEEQHPCKKQKC